MPDGSLLSAELKIAGRLDGRVFALLDDWHKAGSINQAARTAGRSYNVA